MPPCRLVIASFPVAVVLWLSATPCSAASPEFAPPKSLGDVAAPRNVQRTMRLLAESTPERRKTVRVLFYGQSITEQAWWKTVADDLRRRFPNADLMIENRAIGGHASQLLVKTMTADVAPFRPDLIVFHVYGAHDKHEDIFRTLRETTTAEVLQQNDHVTQPAELEEPTDPAAVRPGAAPWIAFINHNWLPAVSQKYDTALCDVRGHWKRYLADYGLQPSDLLRDGVHLNERGEFLMARIVSASLVYDSAAGPSPAEEWVKTLPAPEPTAGRLRIEFEGSRVDALLNQGGAAADVLIDGRPPGAHPGCYAFTRAGPYPGMNWPCLLRVGSRAPLVAEEWTATLHDVSPDAARFRFAVTGSVTGEEGEGSSDAAFVSKSGRVVIEPEDWNLAYACKVRADAPPPGDGFAVRWQAVSLGIDRIGPPSSAESGVTPSVTLAQALENGPHVLEIVGTGPAPVAAVRAYAPPLERSSK